MTEWHPKQLKNWRDSVHELAFVNTRDHGLPFKDDETGQSSDLP